MNRFLFTIFSSVNFLKLKKEWWNDVYKLSWDVLSNFSPVHRLWILEMNDVTGRDHQSNIFSANELMIIKQTHFAYISIASWFLRRSTVTSQDIIRITINHYNSQFRIRHDKRKIMIKKWIFVFLFALPTVQTHSTLDDSEVFLLYFGIFVDTVTDIELTWGYRIKQLHWSIIESKNETEKAHQQTVNECESQNINNWN